MDTGRPGIVCHLSLRSLRLGGLRLLHRLGLGSLDGMGLRLLGQQGLRQSLLD